MAIYTHFKKHKATRIILPGILDPRPHRSERSIDEIILPDRDHIKVIIMSSTHPEVKVFVAGRFDKLTAGDIQFLRDAKALGTHLTVSFVSSEFVFRHEFKPSVLGDEHVKAILEALEMVDEVCIGRDPVDQIGLEFQSDFLRIKPDILAVSSLDKFGHHKRKVCESIGASYKIIPVSLPMVVPQKEVVDKA